MLDNNKIKLLILWDILCKNTDENHAMNADEIREELAKRGISVIRRVVADDIVALNKYGYNTNTKHSVLATNVKSVSSAFAPKRKDI